MSAHELLADGGAIRAFAVIRTDTAAQAIDAGRACLRGGVRYLEVTLTTPGALSAVEALAAEKGAIVGIGSVTDPQQVKDGNAAGARFAVSPHFDADILAEAKSLGLLSAMGGVTPTEAMTCHRAGVDVIKVFPAASFGGAAHLKAMREPLPFLRLMPTGGVDLSNIAAYLAAGAWGLGFGGALVDRKTAAAGDWDSIESRARVINAGFGEHETKQKPKAPR